MFAILETGTKPNSDVGMDQLVTDDSMLVYFDPHSCAAGDTRKFIATAGCSSLR